MQKQKILLVEDDLNLGQILKEYLDIKGFDTKLCRDGEEGFEAFENDSFDLCIFDIMLPKKDGFSLAREIKVADKITPIIFLTAKSMKQDTIEGFKLGADDYITKPFSMEELLLRIKAILRRSGSNAQSKPELQVFKIGGFTFDYDLHQLTYNNVTTKLTSKEAELLKLFCLNINQTLDRSTALKIIWRDDSYFNARSMDVYITKLRKYLKEDPTLEILTVRGTGFKLVEKTL
ncbi:response regulator transcription factor [Fulvivirgaceae bacterium BMA12]|uniref:Response regulator transcription factor n=1 Tax=Agaribacillus aureus TaxID=3051825 RepID=A0ABT8LHZ5_9BACT|nr:response regulator transcription factor [Fulvivirgaceae bacterium BMA12]